MSFKEIKLPPDKNFGYFFSVVFLLLSLYFIYKNNYDAYFFCTSFLFVSFFLVSLLKPKILNPLNRLWMFFGYVLSKIFTPIIFSMIFFLLITPISILQRLFKKSDLETSFSKDISYWQTRKKENYENTDFKNQY